MWAHKSKLHKADVITVFENQDDADEAVLQLRLSGFRDAQIGYFAQHEHGLTDLLDHDREFAGSVIGGVTGAVLGVGMAKVMNEWFASMVGASDFFGLAITLASFGALFVGFIGWCIGVAIPRPAVAAPAVDPNVGPFILAVESGDTPELARSIMHEYGGHDLPPGAMLAHPAAV
jgi:hypothetical protein